MKTPSFRMFRGVVGRIVMLIGLVGAGGEARAQWTTQSMTLNPGWNAAYLQVQPANDDCDVLFAGIPVESVWSWNRRFSTVQFIQDAAQLVPGQPDWLTYLPADNPGRATRNLFALQGAHPYLIKLKPGSVATVWNVVGQPTIRPIDWLPDSLNFVGFSIGNGPAPNFQDFFSGSPAHAGQPIYRMSASGQWSLISTPATVTMRAGEAFWINCKGASTFSGPLQLTLEQNGGLQYGQKLTEQTVRLKNNSSSIRSLTLQLLASQNPPTTNSPLLAGSVPLSYYQSDAGNLQFGWTSFSSQLQKALQPGEEWVLRLAVNRPQMAPFTPPTNNPGVLYQNLLQIADSTGVSSLVPVTAQGLTNYSSATGTGPSPKGGTVVSPRAGLWVGSAVINRVSQPASISSPTNPLPVGTPFQFRLLVHVDDNGNARLLQKVIEMYKNGTFKPDPNNPSNNIVDQPGHYVLVTDDALLSQFTGATLRDGTQVGRRLSSAAFGFRQPLALAANGDFGSGSFSCQVNLDYDDPVNPFKHRYHPDHDNLDPTFQNKLGEGAESFTVLRQIELDFTAQDPDNLTISGWGDNQLGGIYKETISGLHSKAIYVLGTFRLTRGSTIGLLNDGLQ